MPNSFLVGARRGVVERSRRRWSALWHGPAVLVLAAALAACATPVRRDAVPLALTDRASVLSGVPDARYWVDTQVPDMAKTAAAALDRERAYLGKAGPPAAGEFPRDLRRRRQRRVRRRAADRLDGTGRPPEFKLVTGISTGTLIAPFAFIGSSDDDALRHV